MATYIFNVDTVQQGSATPSMSTYGGVFVAAGVTVASTAAVALIGWDAGHHFFNILGNVIGNEKAIWIEGVKNRIFVGSEGFVAGTSQTSSDHLGYAIFIPGEETRIDNRGVITGQTNGIHLGAAGDEKSVIINKGEIYGSDTGFSTYAESVVFRNSGLLSSDGEAFHGSTKVDRLINSGSIVGDVMLLGGNDVYDGRKGMVEDGTVYGGNGDDIIRGGSDVDLLSGGNGNDTLYGGDGQDVFIFDTAVDAANNLDKIKDFNVRDDMIGLNGGIFNLEGISDFTDVFVANKTGKAADANDHFIYQTTTGKLFYDVDGKGGSDAVVFAELSKGLKLTADNFEVL